MSKLSGARKLTEATLAPFVVVSSLTTTRDAPGLVSHRPGSARKAMAVQRTRRANGLMSRSFVGPKLSARPPAVKAGRARLPAVIGRVARLDGHEGAPAG